jgi:hypothetical protein
MRIPSSLLNDFYRAAARGSDTYQSLIRIGNASGFYSGSESDVVLRGIRAVAIENTDEAVEALVKWILKGPKGYMWYEQAGQGLALMTIPKATEALDYLIQKSWDSMSRSEFERKRKGHDWLLNHRRQPIVNVLVDMHNRAKSKGFRISRTADDFHRSAYGSNAPLEGWIYPPVRFPSGAPNIRDYYGIPLLSYSLVPYQ